MDMSANISDNLSSCANPTNFDSTDFLVKNIPDIIAVSKILPPIWWTIGIIGNIIALIVWLQPKMRHSSGYYLAALAISDLCFLPMNIVYELHFTYNKHLLDKPVLCEWFAISYLSVQYMSPVLVLAFTVERYLSVCHPFRMVNINKNNSKSTIIIILGLTALCVGINAAHGYFWTTAHAGSNVCDVRADILGSSVWTIWTWTTEMLIFAAVPLTVLVLNILVIIEVSNISKLERRNMRTNSIDRRSTTFMLLGVSFYQILTVLPVTVVYALYNKYAMLSDKQCLTDAQIAEDPTINVYLQYMSARTMILNVGMSHYAANFFIYMLTGKIFRKQLYELVVLFCCRSRVQYLAMRTISTRTTRMSLTTTNRSSIAKGRFGTYAHRTTDQCNNDTELGTKNSMYSPSDLLTHESSTTANDLSSHQCTKESCTQAKLLPCVEESDMDDYDKD